MDGSFQTTGSQPFGWTHLVLNYIGPNNGQGIQIYFNGMQIGSDNTKSGTSYQPGDGRVILGRHHLRYAGADVDELLFFNKTLSDQEIMDIKNMV